MSSPVDSDSELSDGEIDPELEGDLFSSGEEQSFVDEDEEENPEILIIKEYYERAFKLSQEVQTYNQIARIPGLKKLTKAVKKEAKYLKTLSDHAEGKHTDLGASLLLPAIPSVSTSNLPHHEALFSIIKSEHDVTYVSKRFTIEKDRSKRDPSVEIDVVAENGIRWIKVKAQNAQSIQRLVENAENCRHRCILDVAKDIMKSAQNHMMHFEVPEVVFYFSRGVTEGVARSLRELGVVVRGRIFHDSSLVLVDSGNVLGTEIKKDLEESEKKVLRGRNRKLNLDVTAMVTFVTDLTNGGDDHFADKLLQVMATNEKKEPALPVIKSFIEGRDLIICDTAYTRFMKLLTTIGGPRETARAKKILDSVERVRDQPSERAMNLGGSISQDNKIVFGTGDTLCATTLTANRAMLRSAETQGVVFSVFLHPPRSLSEDARRLQH